MSHRRQLMGRYDMKEIIKLVAKQYGIIPEEILDGRNKDARKAAVYLTKRHTEETNREIGERVGGVSYPAVSKSVERMEKEMEANQSLRKDVNRMEGNLSQVNRLRLRLFLEFPFFKIGRAHV